MPAHTPVRYLSQRTEELEIGAGEAMRGMATLLVTYEVLDHEDALGRFENEGQPLKSCLIMCYVSGGGGRRPMQSCRRSTPIDAEQPRALAEAELSLKHS
jgi:hypothetical protein